MILFLNPLVKLKKNKGRILIYKIDEFLGEPEQISPIHPSFAILLAMFDGKKSYDQVLKDFFYVTSNEDTLKNREFIENQLKFIQNERLHIDKLLMNISEIKALGINPNFYSPEDFIIPLDEIDIKLFDKRIDFPLSINYNVSTNCSFHCRYCYHPRFPMNEYISLERLKDIFDECKEQGLECITLSGGDPFERPDLFDIIRTITDRKLNYFLSTKSYLDPETCSKLREVGLTKTQISIDAAEPKLAAFLAGGPSDFLEKTIETIKNLKTVGVKIRLKCVVNGYNIEHLKDFLDLSKQLEVEKVQLVQYGKSIWHHEDKLFPTKEQMQVANEIVQEFRNQNSFPQIIGGFFATSIINNNGKVAAGEDIFEGRAVCNAGRFSLTLLPNGEVSICEQLNYSPEIILGDLRTQTIMEFWHSEKVKNWLSCPPREYFDKDSPCYWCEEANYQKCHQLISRCLRDSYKYFGNYHSPDVKCKLATVENLRIS